MLNKEVIPSRFMRNLSPEELLPHNEQYFSQCKTVIESSPNLGRKISKEEVEKVVLLQIREAQLDGKRAEERLGTDHEKFVEEIIQQMKDLSPVAIFIDYFQFPLYAISLYLVGYAFFTFLLSAWFGYSLTAALFYQIPFSAVGLLLVVVSLSVLYVMLFRRKKSAKLLFKLQNAEFRNKEILNYIGIGLTFLVPYVLLRLQFTVVQFSLWFVLITGIAGVLIARQRFVATDTMPV